MDVMPATRLALNTWKVLAEKDVGVSHTRQNLPCQDYFEVQVLRSSHGEYLSVVCSDGAGSAKLSEHGSRFVCEWMQELIQSGVQSGKSLEDLQQTEFPSWVESVHKRIEKLAIDGGYRSRDFSCTLIVAVLGESESLFAQIGDGAIVRWDGETYETVFWPDNGEYANVTTFVTSKDYLDHLYCKCLPIRTDEIAVLTDGLQSIALKYSDRTAHDPFFAPMFNALRGKSTAGELQEDFKKFLSSPSVNARTDDDKTLILATRRPNVLLPNSEAVSSSSNGDEAPVSAEPPSTSRERAEAEERQSREEKFSVMTIGEASSASVLLSPLVLADAAQRLEVAPLQLTDETDALVMAVCSTTDQFALTPDHDEVHNDLPGQTMEEPGKVVDVMHSDTLPERGEVASQGSDED